MEEERDVVDFRGGPTIIMIMGGLWGPTAFDERFVDKNTTLREFQNIANPVT